MKNQILSRTLNIEILITALVVIGVLLSVFITADIAYNLSLVVSGKLDMSTAATIVGLKIPLVGIEFFPLALILSTLLVLGRMAQDSELVILLASGVGYRAIYKITFKLIIPIAVILGIITLYAIPILKTKVNALSQTTKSGVTLKNLSAGKFYELKGGNRVIYTEQLDDGLMSEVFLQISDNKTQHLLKAKTGRIEMDEAGHKLLSLYDGTRYSYEINSLSYTVMQYKKYSVLLDAEKKYTQTESIEQTPTIDLLKNLSNKNNQAEWQFRLSIPIMSIIMMIIGISLSNSKPRSSKYGMLLPGLMIYFIYYNFIFIAKDKIITSEINPWLGIWLVHGVLLLLTIFLVWRTLRPLKTR